ncbi:MAG: sigma-70 family RNA polymerase sigma factor [Syntrophomonadaceae bacterium]|nr:sigma-70 family RNA polymerase sigma factor [Syntrophomonadaceae bacterium]MDH7496827.1 sigma-70 family RNA polymerase sigma factor [Syntrophomonadaceae bacterium]
MSKLRQGDAGAFEALVVAYQDRVFTQCYHLTGSLADAQDLAQEVFLRAYRGLHAFRGDADLGTWLHRIAVNTYLNGRRKYRPEALFSLDDPVPGTDGDLTRQLAAQTEDPVERLERLEIQAAVQEALAQLSPDFRAILVLREFEDCSYEEMASLLGCSVGTVKSRLNRARRALRDRVKDIIKTDADNRSGTPRT